MHKHNRELLQSFRNFNDKYNSNYVQEKFIDNLLIESNNNVWLLNFNYSIYKVKLFRDTNSINFIDLGCGKGFVIHYALENSLFKSYLGVDNDFKNINDASNYFSNNKNVSFEFQDASVYELPYEESIIFMFNPFNWEVLRKFINKNMETLISTKSVILYLNDQHINEILENFIYAKLLFRDEILNVSILEFVGKNEN